LKILTQNPLTLSGIIIISLVLFIAVFAPWLSPYDPNYIDIHSILLPPSVSHFMGTDGLGRDVFSRMLYGSRISLLVGILAVGIATVIGTFLGAIAGFYRGYIDSIIMRFVDIMLSIPTFFLILAVIAFFNTVNLEHYDCDWTDFLDGCYSPCSGRVFKSQKSRIYISS
jgi:peptide/nickel transport system permease protein